MTRRQTVQIFLLLLFPFSPHLRRRLMKNPFPPSPPPVSGGNFLPSFISRSDTRERQTTQSNHWSRREIIIQPHAEKGFGVVSLLLPHNGCCSVAVSKKIIERWELLLLLLLLSNLEFPTSKKKCLAAGLWTKCVLVSDRKLQRNCSCSCGLKTNKQIDILEIKEDDIVIGFFFLLFRYAVRHVSYRKLNVAVSPDNHLVFLLWLSFWLW